VQQLRASLTQGLVAIIITSVCVVAATQALQLLGLKLYAPWKLFVWWPAFEWQAPDVFARAGWRPCHLASTRKAAETARRQLASCGRRFHNIVYWVVDGALGGSRQS
jgi:hypothetical protein